LSGYLLLTGATGLLGRYLVRDLLQRGVRLAVLARGSKKEAAQQRMETILQDWERQGKAELPRPVILEGDLRQPLLGLDSDARRWVARNCQQLCHSAASLTFHADGSGEPWTTNLEGTRHMLALCQETGIRQLHHVSTAYVCGLREGTILESELDCGQEFRNDYEQSKLEAEKLVRQADFLDQLTVYRPAVIAGDSRTGYTNTYHGIYLYLRLMALIVPRQPAGPDGTRITRLRLPMTGEERRNVIPIDWVSRVMTHLLLQPAAHGRTFHLAPDQCLTPSEVINAGYRYFNSTGVEYVGYRAIDPATYNAFEAEILPGFAMYHNYESTDPHFDCRNLKEFAGQLPCPKIDEAMLHTYLQYGEEDRWGKRRARPAAYDTFAVDFLRSCNEWSEEPREAAVTVLGLDLHGPGGGQWTIRLSPDGSASCSVGLPDEQDYLLRLNVREFEELVAPRERLATAGHPLPPLPARHPLHQLLSAPPRASTFTETGRLSHVHAH
jgi:thioester reductase-like protein